MNKIIPLSEEKESNNVSNKAEKTAERLKMYYLTWNLQGKALKENEMNILLPKTDHFDFYVIGTEECTRSILASFFYANKSDYESMLQKHLGEQYVMVKSENLDAIHIIVFVHVNARSNITNVDSGTIKNGVANMVGNKGAVAVAFQYNFTSFLFINCHLAAGQSSCDKRNKDFERINKELSLNGDFYGKENYRTITDQFDVVIWSGDFNYRIDNADKTYITQCCEDQSDFLVDGLLEYDQMTREINSGNLKLNRFLEGKINFFPTYKFEVGTDNYILGDGDRIPGWTDRIIYKSAVKSFLELKEYNWIKEIQSSDHKPVIGIFDLNIPKANMTLSNMKQSEKGSKACNIF